MQHYNGIPQRVREYFEHVPRLAEHFPWDVCLAYQFSRVELAQNMSIYCGAVKLHRAHPDLAWTAVQMQHFKRESFRERFATIFGADIPSALLLQIEAAEKVRDKIMHGKSVPEVQKRSAVCEVLTYASAFNDFANAQGGIRPFGDLRGFKGRAKSLDKSTSKWLLKGLGLPLS